MSFRKKTTISFIVVIALFICAFSCETRTKSDQHLNPIRSIKLSKTSVNLSVGKKTIISAKITYTNDYQDKEKYFWSSEDKKIATISKKGIIKAKANGITYVTCTSNGKKVKVRCKVLVRNPYNKVNSINFSQKQIRVQAGDKRVLSPSIKFSGNKSYTTEPLEWSSSNTKVAKISSKGVVKGISNGTTYISIKSKFTAKKASIKLTVGPTKYIAYTFDDGPGIYTKKLVNALVKYDGKATFFTLGNSIKKHKDALKYEHSHGMEVASHTYHHYNLKKCSKKTIKREIDRTKRLIYNTIGVYPTLLRPPYGNYNKTVARDADVPMMYWSVDTLDWKHKKVKYVRKSILRQSDKWDVVLLHDIHKTSVEGFIKALPALKKNNYELVTVSELYQIYGKKMKPGVMYYGPEDGREKK